ncbi:hypothetical protein [Achromobacter mucicolens]|uniref:hypothetical protein n=1 Tax=Achromobacter mucicolens TaxID=1389922 RepID=UPI002FE1A88A
MHKPHDPGSNVHFLNRARSDQPPGGGVLESLHEALIIGKERRSQSAQVKSAANEQRIDGDGNTQLTGEIAQRQSIRGNNNIQIGAVQLVVNVKVNVQR